MSVLQRVRRSRSKTAPETRRDFVQSNGTIPTSTSDLSTPSSIPTPQPLAVPASEMGTELQSIPDSSTEIMEALSTSQLLEETPSATIAMTTIKERLEDHPDNGSSSLSELGDASDDHSEPTPRASVVAEPTDNDSEAETERLEATPRKLTRTATSTSMASEQPYERTPSKLAYSKAIDQDDSIPPTPSVTAKDAIAIETGDDSALHALSIVAASEGASLADIAGKKRKRSSAETSSADEPTDEPARKRSGTARDTTLNGSPKDLAVPSEHLDVEEVLSHAEERISQLAREEADLEERQADVVIEAVSEIATVAKLTKPRKGGRKGKRKAEEAADTINELVAEAQEGEVDGEHDDEDSGALDEESVKKKHAISQLAKIEKKFKIFREKLCDEQIARYEQELEMLKQPNCIHPEYLTMIQSIDERRNEKIAYERQLLQYKQKCLEIRTVAERHQLHSQYFQTVRDLREKSLEECNQRIYDLQRGRRQLGVEDIQYSIKLPEKRSEQIRQQAAYNLEVSILSGVAKYVGFPAAPDIRPARPSEIEDDFRAMKITARPAAIPNFRPYNRTSTVDEAAAEEQFIERTPWANPQHPAHQQSQYAPGPSRVPSQAYQTPAGQRRIVDINAPNGSASTIDVNSNPPSSTAGPGPQSSRVGESESPVLQMKRHPSGHPSHSETPSSHTRNFTGLARDPYAGNPHILSSPAAPHSEQPPDDIGRWSGNSTRPVNAGILSASGSTIPGRPEAGKVPLTQRSGLGTVSVGSSNGIFGR